MTENILDFHDSLASCTDVSGIATTWQDWMTRLGYARSGIFTFARNRGSINLDDHDSNWESQILDEYFAERFYQFDLASNPIARQQVVQAGHISTFKTSGKPDRVYDFIDFVDGVCLPGEISVPVNIENGRRLAFNGWTVGSTIEFAKQTRAHGEIIRQAAIAAGAAYVQICSNGASRHVNPLSPREIECLLWLSKGLRNNAIGKRLGIDVKTVDLHLKNARHKLNANTSTEAVAISILNKFIRP